MKRQTKPFSVEIKRSRRSTPLNDHPGPDTIQKKSELFKQSIDERLASGNQSEFEKPDEARADLKVPAFLQTAKGSEGPRPPAESSLAYSTTFRQSDKIIAEMPSAARILPCLTSEAEPESLILNPHENSFIRLKQLGPSASLQSSKASSDKLAGALAAFDEYAEPSTTTSISSKLQICELPTEETHSDVNSNLKRRAHRFLKVDRENAASLPPGQRWKRRMLTRAR